MWLALNRETVLMRFVDILEANSNSPLSIGPTSATTLTLAGSPDVRTHRHTRLRPHEGVYAGCGVSSHLGT